MSEVRNNHQEILRSVPLLKDLNPSLISALIERSKEIAVESGSQLFSEGEAGDAVYLLIEGAIQITARNDGAESLVLARLGPGELFGEHYLAPDQERRRSAGARAQEPSRLLRISESAFQDVLLRDPHFAAAIEARRARMSKEVRARRAEILREFNSTAVQDPSRYVSYAPGTLIFREGDPADAAYFIVSGMVEIFSGISPTATLAELGAGQCFGERACIQDTPRTASARALTALQVQVIPREHFIQLYRQSPSLQQMVAGLDFVYKLPNRGAALLFYGRHSGEESVERLYRLEDGRRFLSSYIPGLSAFRLERVADGAAPQAQEYAWTEQATGEIEKKRLLKVSPSGEIVGLHVVGDWPDLPQIIASAIDAKRVSQNALENFTNSGSLLEKAAAVEPGSMTCFCMQVETARILELAAAGCNTFESLRQKTGCGSVCGGCEPQIQALLGKSEWIPVAASSAVQTPDIRTFTLEPIYPARIEWKTGQHVVISGRIGEHWVNRCYTITSPPGQGRSLEIAVKREPQGLFSRWLFEGALHEKQLRIAPPRGDAVWEAGAKATVCLVAGIGVTPAAAILRSHAAAGAAGHLHIDYSGLTRQQMAFVDELEAAAATRPNITVFARATDTNPFLDVNEINRLVKEFPGADFFLCGPTGYTLFAKGALLSAGVDPKRIREEVFVHAGSPPAATPAARPRFIRTAYDMGLALVAAATFLLIQPSAAPALVSGHFNTGHEKLDCEACHTEAPGTLRQQLQAKAAHLLGARKTNADFGFMAVGNETCTSCHVRPKDTHPPHLFMESRYQAVRQSLAPHQCVACHREHNGVRVTLTDGKFCSACHQKIELKHEPLAPPKSPTHADLTASGRWDTCMGCHDYHDNHLRKTPQSLADAAPEVAVADYFHGTGAPYGNEVKVRARKPSKENI